MDKEGKRILLGCDVSTTCIGICLLEDDGSDYGKIIELTHIKPKAPTKIKGIEQLFIKKKIFQQFLLKYKDIGIDEVIIEEPLMRSNNANTVTTLLRFNGMISDCIYNELGVVPQYISSYDARRFSFPELMAIRKYGKNEEQYPYKKIEKEIKDAKFVLFGSYPWTIDKKVVMHDKVCEVFPNIEWIYDNKGNLKKENYDAVDSYVCLLGFMNKEKHGELNFSSKIIGESNDGNGNVKIDYEVSYWDKNEKRTTYVNV